MALRKEENAKKKTLAIIGPTAVGKSDLAVELALRFNGEVISADSRQVYRGLDIGTGKITEEEMKGVPHHLLDIREPQQIYSAADFKRDAESALKDIQARNRLPIICGGSAFYIHNLVHNLALPEVPPNQALRENLNTLATEDLYQQLQIKAPAAATTIDPRNRHRLIRSLEISEALGEIPKQNSTPSPYTFLQIGLTLPKEELRERIKLRLKKRLENGLLEEAEVLHKNGLSLERMHALGLEYHFLALWLEGNLTLSELEEQLFFAIWHYAKRQLTFWKRDNSIEWFSPFAHSAIFERVEKFLQN